MKVWHGYAIIAAIMVLMAIPVFAPHPYQHLCLYRYDTRVTTVPNRHVVSYDVVKMPTVCINAGDEGFARTARTTVESGLDTPEVRARIEKKFRRLVAAVEAE